MTGRPIAALQADFESALRQAAAQIQQVSKPVVSPINLRMGLITAVAAGTPATCSVQYDTVTPGPSVAGIRYLNPVRAGQVAYVATVGQGDTWVVGQVAELGWTTVPITGLWTNVSPAVFSYCVSGGLMRFRGLIRATAGAIAANAIIATITGFQVPVVYNLAIPGNTAPHPNVRINLEPGSGTTIIRHIDGAPLNAYLLVDHIPPIPLW